MVGSSLDRELINEYDSIDGEEVFREFGGMKPLDFVLYELRHPEDYYRTQYFFDICSASHAEKILIWTDIADNYQWN